LCARKGATGLLIELQEGMVIIVIGYFSLYPHAIGPSLSISHLLKGNTPRVFAQLSQTLFVLEVKDIPSI